MITAPALPGGAVRAGRRAPWPTTSSCCRCCRSTGWSWPTATRFDYDGDPDAHARRRSPGCAPGDVAGYERFLDYSRQVSRPATRSWSARPFLRFADMVRVAPAAGAAARRPHGLRRRGTLREGRAAAPGAVVPRAAGRRQPFETSAIYTLIPYLERKWGVFFPRGGTGALVQALARCSSGWAASCACARPVEQHRARTGRGDRVTTCHRRAGRREALRRRGLERRPAPHLRSPLRRQQPPARRPAAQLERMDWSMSLFVLYFGTAARYPGIAHHTVLFGPRYQGLLARSSTAPRCPRTSACTCTRPRSPIPAWPRPAARPSTCWRRCPTWATPPSTGGRDGEAYADRILASLERACCPVCAGTS